MPFLRKRSRSQSSAFNGDDDCHSMRSGRKESNEKSLIQRRYSGVSEVSSRSDDYGVNESCVMRNFPKHKSSHLRFLAWVAYTRKYDVHAITDDERRTCPLLWCREVLKDQEAMLKHVWECESLSRGLYWCFHCQRPERVGKFQCKRCQGLPSKTDRLATVAKRIFSKLGTKQHRNESSYPNPDMSGRASMAMAKIPESTESDRFPEVKDTFEQDEIPNYEPLPELPNTYISEMGNTSIIPEMDCSWNVSPQNPHNPPPVPEERSEYSAGLYSNMAMDPPDNAFSEANPPWSPSSFETQAPVQKLPGRSVPVLALITRDIYQPPSSRHRHGRTGTLSDEPMSATVVSPLSDAHEFYTNMLGMSARGFDVSPTDTPTTCNSASTHDSGYATMDSAWSATTMDFDRMWDAHDKGMTTDYEVFPMVSKTATGGDTGLMKPPPQPLSATPSNPPSRSSSNSSHHSANRCTALVRRKSLSPHWTDSKSLVESFVEVLNEHLEHTHDALKQLPSTPTIKELLAMSSASIISIGFDVLRGLLEKRNPTAIISIFAFSHVAYAAAIAVEDQSSKVRTEEWFQDCLFWLSGLTSERQRMSYTLIVQAIWKPQDLTEMGDLLDFSKLTETAQPSMEHENRLVRACKHFLDIQENLANEKASTGQKLSQASSLTFSQASFCRAAKNRIIDELIQKISIEAFIEDVVAVEKRLREGSIKDLRQLELELICAGKLASQSDVTYDRFLSHVTCLCDTLYSEGESDKSRTEYQIRDIDLTKALLPEEGATDDVEFESFGFDDLMKDHDAYLNIGSADFSLDAFAAEAGGILDDSYFTSQISTPMTSTPLARSQSDPNPTNCFRQPRTCTPSSSTVLTSSPFLPPPTSISAAASGSHSSSAIPPANTSSSSEYNKHKCHCGYIPCGEEKWKASNLTRHKRTQHPVEVKAYKCSFPGCASTFTRSDNLRSHARDKGHDLKRHGARRGNHGDVGEGNADRDSTETENESRGERPEDKRRPVKRRKVMTSAHWTVTKDESGTRERGLDSKEVDY